MSPLCQAFVYGLLYIIKLCILLVRLYMLITIVLTMRFPVAIYDDNVPSDCFLTEDYGPGHNI